MRQATTNRRDAGFTLIELLISITLLAFLSLLLFGGLRFGARAWERSEAHNSGMDDVRAVQGLLRREITQAYPYFVATDSVHPYVDFDGNENGVNFLAPAPQAAANAGRASIEFSRQTGGGRLRLVMRARPELSAGGAHEELLFDNLASVHFHYFGADAPGALSFWRDSWRQSETMPRLVRIDVQFPKGDARVWPALIVATEISADATCAYDFATKHCQGRP